MREIRLLNASKETDNKLRWETRVEGAPFELYIPKWRAPTPWPAKIIVHIETDLESGKPWLIEKANQLPQDKYREQPIIAVVNRVREHTRTVRFDPDGDPDSWEIGSPYIPYELLDNEQAPQVLIRVMWDNSMAWS